MTSSPIGPDDGAAVSLPNAAQVRAEVQQMVDFGPRLTGYPGHDQFCTWIERAPLGGGERVRARYRR